MVTSSRELDRIFGALADAKRRAILRRLAEGEATVGELAEPFDVSRPAISKHLRVLEGAGLVRRTPEGRMSRCELDAAPMREAAEWVARYRRHWEGRLDALADLLERDPGRDPGHDVGHDAGCDADGGPTGSSSPTPESGDDGR